jgi:hypothetical protein
MSSLWVSPVSSLTNYADPLKNIIDLDWARAAARSTGLGVAADAGAALWAVAVEVDKDGCGLHIGL